MTASIPSLSERPGDRELAARLREALRGAGYDSDALAATIDAGGDWMGLPGPELRWRTREAPSAQTLLRLFFLEEPASLEEAQGALGAASVDGFLDVGLLSRQDAHVRATVQLLPWRGLIVAGDLARDAMRDDHVMPVTTSSGMLADFMPDSRCGDALELGTGSGAIALLAARFSRRVVGADINPRAIEFARFNAAFNGFDNVELVAGDLFAPVEGRRFDRIYFNVPFIVSPDSRITFRETGEGDRFAQRFVRAAPAHLNEGGICQLTLHAVQTREEDWRDRVRSWLDESECDAWLLQGAMNDIGNYASCFCEGGPGYERRYAEWMEFYEEQGIEGVGNGLLFLRKATGAEHFFQVDRVPARDRWYDDLGGFVERCFDRHRTAFEEGDPRELALVPSPLLRAVQSCDLEGEEWRPGVSKLVLREGPGYSIPADTALLDAIGRLDGQRTLAQASAEPVALETVRNLMRFGFLAPAEPRS